MSASEKSTTKYCRAHKCHHPLAWFGKDSSQPSQLHRDCKKVVNQRQRGCRKKANQANKTIKPVQPYPRSYAETWFSWTIPATPDAKPKDPRALANGRQYVAPKTPGAIAAEPVYSVERPTPPIDNEGSRNVGAYGMPEQAPLGRGHEGGEKCHRCCLFRVHGHFREEGGRICRSCDKEIDVIRQDLLAFAKIPGDPISTERLMERLARVGKGHDTDSESLRHGTISTRTFP